jgi:Arc/MetJ-type ribon-helix-helix transcriptional regulator
MSLGLSPENEAFLRRELATGKTQDEVINAGLNLLRSREKLLARLDEGRRQLDEGECTEYDDRSLDAFFEGLLPASDPST